MDKQTDRQIDIMMDKQTICNAGSGQKKLGRQIYRLLDRLIDRQIDRYDIG